MKNYTNLEGVNLPRDTENMTIDKIFGVISFRDKQSYGGGVG